jgi:DNA polymerase-3 subunit gamma/tau
MLAFSPDDARAPRIQPATGSSANNADSPTLDTSKKNGSPTDWSEVVAALEVSGMARMLAQHCELVRHDGDRMDLSIPKMHERLLDKPYQEKLKAALQQRYGSALRVTIAVGDANGSPAAMADRERQRKQAQAVAEIEQDPFVRELVENFDARVVESTIKPLDQ